MNYKGQRYCFRLWRSAHLSAASEQPDQQSWWYLRAVLQRHVVSVLRKPLKLHGCEKFLGRRARPDARCFGLNACFDNQ